MRSIGLDLHRKHCQICEIEGDDVLEYRVGTTREALIARFGRRPRCRILIEAATESEWVGRCLEGLGHEVIVADPNFAPMYATLSRRVKTDRRDARALAEACRAGTYRPSHRLSDERRELRSRLLVREALVQNRTRLVNLCRALLRQQGIAVRTGAAKRFPLRVAELDLEPVMADVIAPLVEQVRVLTMRIARLDGYLATLAEKDTEVERLCTVPGVGPVTAAMFICTLDRPDRFRNARGVRGFLGLVPREDSSGERQRRGAITKVGNRRMRVLLVEAAWSVCRSRSAEAQPLKEWADRIALRRGRRRAIVALARKLAGILWAMWQRESAYQAEEVPEAA